MSHTDDVRGCASKVNGSVANCEMKTAAMLLRYIRCLLALRRLCYLPTTNKFTCESDICALKQELGRVEACFWFTLIVLSLPQTSLKHFIFQVDADVIQKEKKRAVGPPSSDEDSWEEGHSDDSDRPKLFKHHRGPIKLPKVGDNSSDSDSDLDNRPTQRWSTSTDLDTGQNPKPVPASSQAPPIGLSSTVSTSLLPTKPVFGVPPFSVR